MCIGFVLVDVDHILIRWGLLLFFRVLLIVFLASACEQG